MAGEQPVADRIGTKLIAIQQQLKAPKDLKNEFAGFQYRSAEKILEAVKPLLNKHGLYLTLNDTMINVGDRNYVCSTVTLSNGEDKIEVTANAREEEVKKGMDTAQITGSASSYARKYALNGLFAIDDTKDPDGQDNTKHESVTPKSTVKYATVKQWSLINEKLKAQGFDNKDDILEHISGSYLIEEPAKLTMDEASMVIEDLLESAK